MSNNNNNNNDNRDAVVGVPNYGEPWEGARCHCGHSMCKAGYVPNHISGKGTASMEDIERIVACVNALAGMDPAAVASLVRAAEAVCDDTLALDHVAEQSRIDRLRAALAALRGKR